MGVGQEQSIRQRAMFRPVGGSMATSQNRPLRPRGRARAARIAFGAVALLALLLEIVSAQEQRNHGNPHASGDIAVPSGANEAQYCTSCHKQGCPAPHPATAAMTWPVRGSATLGAHGEVTCGSCHAPGFRRRSDAFLARDHKRLCNACHYGAHAIPNAHETGRPCEACHLLPQRLIARATPAEARAMRPNVDAVCAGCHYSGRITHPIGVPNNKRMAPDLPLSAEGRISCVTCHFGHKRQDRYGQMLRKDNRRGNLCMSCHDDL